MSGVVKTCTNCAFYGKRGGEEACWFEGVYLVDLHKYHVCNNFLRRDSCLTCKKCKAYRCTVTGDAVASGTSSRKGCADYKPIKLEELKR